MLARRIIPCLDIKDGRVVKGTQFKYLSDAGDPLELAKYYTAQGADELVLLDIAATVEERKNRLSLVRLIAESIAIPFSVGGGVNSINRIKELLEAGADKVSIGTAAVINPGFIKEASEKFGSQAIVISIDPKRAAGSKWEVYIKGGRENSGVDILDFVQKMESLGAGELLVNSVDRDGTKAGFDVELLKAVVGSVNLPVIASSGAGQLEHFVEVFSKTGVTAALGASLFHSGELTIKDVKNKLKKEDIEVRL